MFDLFDLPFCGSGQTRTHNTVNRQMLGGLTDRQRLFGRGIPNFVGNLRPHCSHLTVWLENRFQTLNSQPSTLNYPSKTATTWMGSGCGAHTGRTLPAISLPFTSSFFTPRCLPFGFLTSMT